MSRLNHSWKITVVVLYLLTMSTSVIAKDTMRSINYQGVNVREGAGLNHAVLWRVVKYFPYKIIETRGVWKNVQDFEGDRGWIHSRYLSDTKSVIVKNKFVNLRSAPSLKAKKIGQVGYGEVFPVLDIQADWVQIELPNDNQKAWVFRQLVWGL